MDRIGSKWTKLDVDTLKLRVSQKVSVREIASELKRCEKGVRSKGYSIGLKFGRPKQ